MSKNPLPSDLLDKQLLVMKGSEIVELFSHIFNSKQPSQIHTEEKFVAGISGLANYLNCGKTKAQEIKNSGVIDEAIHQIGRKVYFKVAVLDQIRSAKNF